jgi:hypothetical protein
LEACWPCPVFVTRNYTLAFALQLREKHGKTSVRVAEEIQSIHTRDTHTLQNPPTHPHTHTHTPTPTHTHTHITKQFKSTAVQIGAKPSMFCYQSVN